MNFYQFAKHNLILWADDEFQVFVAWNYRDKIYVWRGDANGNVVRTHVRESVLDEERQNLYALQKCAGELFRHYILICLD